MHATASPGPVDTLFLLSDVSNMSSAADHHNNLTSLGGWSLAYGNGTSTCGQPRDDSWHIFRDPVTSDLPWLGVVARVTAGSIWYWCADQVIVQRALAAKNMAHARAATVLAGYLKFTPMFLIILPGMISRVLFKDVIACDTRAECHAACGNEAGCSNSAYPYLILKLAPVGIKGLLLAVMVAALMSSLTSIFNSAVTVFTMDLWRRGRPKATERELLIVGRLFIIVMVGISIAWIPLIMNSQEGQLFMYIQSVTGYIAPPISAIFVLAVFVPRVNEAGAFAGVICGQCVGLVRLVLDFVYPAGKCGEVDERPTIVSKVHFSYFAGIVFIVTAVVALVVSLLTKPQDASEMENLTFWSLRKRTSAANKARSTDKHNASVDRSLEESSGNRKEENDQWSPASGRGRYADTSKVISKSRRSSPLSKPNLTSEVRSGQRVSTETDEDHLKVLEKFDKTWSSVQAPWSYVINLNAVILIAVLAFLCGFFH
ncbi:hypothetical protein Btru_069709 [Bulinus truncatus]|nr:hypothetical protein Btru_069709 [Bulinus truncatus]